MPRTVLMFLLFTILGQSYAQAQVRDLDIPLGTRLRVFAPALGDSSMIGRFAGLQSDSLALVRGPRQAPPLRIPLARIQRLDVSAGRDRASGATVGGLLGIATGVVLGFACLAVCPEDPNGGANMAPAGGLLLGLVVGLPVGAVIGARVAPERWRPLPLPPNGAAAGSATHGSVDPDRPGRGAP